jgi:demethylmenaquinone methyltransferase / 2-methoxy-6-polyprenyl-1,4-benzoquinol methylase
MTDKKGFNLDKFYSKIYKRYDLINKLFTFGLDRKWRRITIEECLNGSPDTVLDLCCGTGDIAISLAQTSNEAITVTGYDMNESMLYQAKLKAEKTKFTNVKFIQGDASILPFQNNYFDRITIGFGFRNLTFSNSNSDKHISEMFRVLKPAGKLLILESGIPKNIFIRLLYKIHLYFILIPLGGLISGDFKAYWYLAHSSSKFYALPELEQILNKHGFNNCTFRTFLFGAANLIIAEKE